MDERDNHQRVSIKTIAYLARVVQDGELRASPTLVYLDEKTRVKPDIFWVAEKTARCRLNAQGYWEGSPDVVVEILSPTTEAIDRGEKFNLYQHAHIYEYWLINPEVEFIEVHVLLNKRFVRHGLFQPSETFSSGAMNGLVIEVSALFGHSS